MPANDKIATFCPAALYSLEPPGAGTRVREGNEGLLQRSQALLEQEGGQRSNTERPMGVEAPGESTIEMMSKYILVYISTTLNHSSHAVGAPRQHSA